MSFNLRTFLSGPKSRSFLITALSGMVVWCLLCAPASNLTSLDVPIEWPQVRSKQIDYSIVPGSEKYYVWVPANYDGSAPFGLMVYISSYEDCTAVPAGWQDVLAKHKMLFVCPQSAGNNCRSQERRNGLALSGALAMKVKYKIDPGRIVAAGISGGARTASDLGFLQSDVFRKTLQDCGTNFCRKVPWKVAQTVVDTVGKPYGVLQATADEVSRAKRSTRFCLITGSGDFRRGNIIDIYNEGFLQDGFQARLFDVPGMGHQDCDAATLEQALQYLVL